MTKPKSPNKRKQKQLDNQKEGLKLSTEQKRMAEQFKLLSLRPFMVDRRHSHMEKFYRQKILDELRRKFLEYQKTHSTMETFSFDELLKQKVD